jgi:hypothetical protein
MTDPIRSAAIKFVNLRRAAVDLKAGRRSGPDTYETNNAVYQRARAAAANALYRLEVAVKRDDRREQ